MRSYQERTQSLQSLGFRDYQAYLESELWKLIRRMVIDRACGICEVCKIDNATQVHHKSYSEIVMRGKDFSMLIACCRNCHEFAEFTGNSKRKTTLDEANERIKLLQSKTTGRKQELDPRKCLGYKKNYAKRGKRYCRKCRK